MNKEFEIHLVIGIGAVAVLYYLYEKYAAQSPTAAAGSLTSILTQVIVSGPGESDPNQTNNYFSIPGL